MSGRFRLLRSPRLDRAKPYGDAEAAVLSEAGFRRAAAELRSWPDYEPTPLRRLEGLASRWGIGALLYKDEAHRFGLGSFKALGGAYGALRALQQQLEVGEGVVATSAELRQGTYAEIVSGITLSCATDGNHGRAVAWAAQLFGCSSVVYVPAVVSDARADAIAAHGAEVVRVEGTFDEAVRRADEDARREGRILISDQAYPGYESLPCDIMQGYMLTIAEVYEALGTDEQPTHVFVQGGVGGLAAAVCSFLWEGQGATRPLLAVVEPETADCLYRSASAGELQRVPGDLHTLMGCLSAGEASTLAWTILGQGVDVFITIPDQEAVRTMRLLADGVGGDDPLVVGESGVAGLAGLGAVVEDQDARIELGLGEGSCVLIFGTEGANDPAAYRSIVGRDPAAVG